VGRVILTDRASHLLIVTVVVIALIVYAAVAGAAGGWLAGAAALLVAGLLAARHRRARFSAYVLLSMMGLRATLGGHWGALAFAAAMILLLQLPPARRAWPRLRRSAPSTATTDCSRMTRL
jgi:hypothetical protein